jgi:hypothetical protein
VYGHAAGDSVLLQMRGRLKEVTRDSDYLIRWEGEVSTERMATVGYSPPNRMLPFIRSEGIVRFLAGSAHIMTTRDLRADSRCPLERLICW